MQKRLGGKVAKKKIPLKGIECETKAELGEDVTEAVIHFDNTKKEEKISLDQ